MSEPSKTDELEQRAKAVVDKIRSLSSTEAMYDVATTFARQERQAVWEDAADIAGQYRTSADEARVITVGQGISAIIRDQARKERGA